MTLNYLKCAFEMKFGKFFNYMDNQQGIEVKPDKIQTLKKMSFLSKPKEKQT